MVQGIDQSGGDCQIFRRIRVAPGGFRGDTQERLQCAKVQPLIAEAAVSHVNGDAAVDGDADDFFFADVGCILRQLDEAVGVHHHESVAVVRILGIDEANFRLDADDGRLRGFRGSGLFAGRLSFIRDLDGDLCARRQAGSPRISRRVFALSRHEAVVDVGNAERGGKAGGFIIRPCHFFICKVGQGFPRHSRFVLRGGGGDGGGDLLAKLFSRQQLDAFVRDDAEGRLRIVAVDRRFVRLVNKPLDCPRHVFRNGEEAARGRAVVTFIHGQEVDGIVALHLSFFRHDLGVVDARDRVLAGLLALCASQRADVDEALLHPVLAEDHVIDVFSIDHAGVLRVVLCDIIPDLEHGVPLVIDRVDRAEALAAGGVDVHRAGINGQSADSEGDRIVVRDIIGAISDFDLVCPFFVVVDPERVGACVYGSIFEFYALPVFCLRLRPDLDGRIYCVVCNQTTIRYVWISRNGKRQL